MDSAVDVPHLRLSLARDSSTGATRARLDYLPREELVSSLSHFDKYFQRLDYELTSQLLHAELYTPTPVSISAGPSQLLSKMIASPFLVDVQVSAAAETEGCLSRLCDSHIDRWCQWVAHASKSTSDEEAKRRSERDASLAKVMVEEYKVRFARVLGEDFAPMAEPLAVCCLGPKDDER